MGDTSAAYQVAIGVPRFDIPVISKGIKRRVGHAQLFSLIEEYRALHEIKASGQHLCRPGAVFLPLVTKFGDCPGLVMVAPKEAVPRRALQAVLPMEKDFFEIRQPDAPVAPLSIRPVRRTGVLKLKHHIQLAPAEAGIFFCLLHRNARAFAHRHDIEAGEDALVHLLQVRMDMGSIDTKRRQVAARPVRQRLGFGDQADHVHAKTVHSLIQPPGHHLKDALPHGRVVPVQIRLFRGKDVQIVHPAGSVILPGGPAKPGIPIVRRAAAASLPPDVVVTAGIAAVGAAVRKPPVLIRRVVDGKVQYDPDPALVRFPQQALKVFHRTEIGLYLLIIADIIPVILVWRGIYRA